MNLPNPRKRWLTLGGAGRASGQKKRAQKLTHANYSRDEFSQVIESREVARGNISKTLPSACSVTTESLQKRV